MRSRLTSAIAVLGVVALLLVAGNTAAYASGGHSFFLGKSNHTKKQTTLTRTRPGTVLSLNAKPGYPALAVNSSAKVANLNADTVDGIDSSQMLNQTLVFTRDVTGVSNFQMELPVGPGTYNLDYSVFMSGAPAANSYCELFSTNGTVSRFVGISQFASASPGHTGGGLLTKEAGGHVQLSCVAGGTFTASGGTAVQVTASPVAVTSGGAARVTGSQRSTAGQN
jgi:hypothetical protein